MTTDRALCTIVAKNYIAFARTLAQSFLSFHPDSKVYVLIVDDFEGYLTKDECFEIVKLTDLDIPDLPAVCFKYDIKELCTAVKARLLQYLLREKSVGKLMYLDPDILVTAPLDHLFEKLSTFDITLTPHLDTDYPADDYCLTTLTSCRRTIQPRLHCGNSGENAHNFLNWWKPKLDENCVVDLMKAILSINGSSICADPFPECVDRRDCGYNVAY